VEYSGCDVTRRADSVSSCQPSNYIGRFVSLLCNLLNRWDFLKQMLSEDDQVLDIDDAVTPGHWTNIT